MIIKSEVTKTKSFLVYDGASDYKIVLPIDAEEYEEKAAKELQEFLFRATGVELETVRETTGTGKYIFLGAVAENAEYKKTAEYALLNKEGFLIKTSGENISIVGKSGRGTLFGVYKFLEKTVGYRYYGIGEIRLNKTQDVPFYAFDFAEMPDIEARSLGFTETFKIEWNPEYPVHTDRLRLARTLYTDWILATHTYFVIMPKSKYFETHRDFYSPSGAELCLSNPQMRKEFLENIKKIALEKKGDYLMIGQEDTFGFCDCPTCKKRVAEDGGNPAGLMMEFSNEMAREMEKWLAETDPTRKLKLVTFAYNATAFAPTKRDGKTGDFKPFKEEYKAADNLAVMLVPRGPAHSKNYMDETYNKRVKDQLLGWQAVAKELHVWTYCVNYDHFLVNFNNIYALRENYAIFKDLGTTFFFDQGPTNPRTPCFDALRQFLQAELLWDTTKDTDALIDEFMDAYYMDIAPYMRAYFNKIFDRWKEIEMQYGVQSYSGGGNTFYLRKDFWSKQFVDECMDLFRVMRGEIERFGTVEEWDKYVTLRNRMSKEHLAVRYLLLHLYGNYFGEDLGIKIKTFRDDCKRYGVEPCGESNQLIELF